MSPTKLTGGRIAELFKGEKPKKVVLQVLTMVHFKYGQPFGYNTGRNWFYHLCVNDGQSFSNFAMLTHRYNDMVESGEINKNCIIQINAYDCYDMKCDYDKDQPRRKVLRITDLTVLQSGADVGQRIGNPLPLNNKVWLDCKEQTIDLNSFPSGGGIIIMD